MSLETYVPRSSNLDACRWDSETQDLTVTFKSGAEYVYRSVPETVWHGLKHAPSAGSYFFRQIRDIYSFDQN